MQLKSFRVQKFRNIEDSGEVELLDAAHMRGREEPGREECAPTSAA